MPNIHDQLELTPAPTRILLTVDEPATALSLGRTYLYRFLMSKEIVSVKVGRVRRVPLSAKQLQAAEKARLGDGWHDLDLVFPNTIARPMVNMHLLRREFLPMLEKAGLGRIRFHDPRHTAATLLLGQGVNPKIVSEMLGHSDVSITLNLYSHVTPHMQQQAAAAMDEALGGER